MKPDDLPGSDDSGRVANGSEAIALADRCVQCGLCLPHCPTYRKTLSEADSPRGRIALMRGVAEGRLPANKRYVAHIDQCLNCGACQAVCPNRVRFDALLNYARIGIESERARSFSRRALRTLALNLLTHPKRVDLMARLLSLYQRSGLQFLARRSGLLRRFGADRLDSHLPPDIRRGARWRERYDPPGKPLGDVGLFLGCVARALDGETLAAAIYVLNRLGYTVHVPREQGCCGALHRHTGEAADAQALLDATLQAFAPLPAVVGTTSGCTAELAIQDSRCVAKSNFIDISTFLGNAAGWSNVEIMPLVQSVFVHDPCTLRNHLGASADPYRLLDRIPGITTAPLAGNDTCCGAAGSYLLTQPEMAQSLLKDKMEALRANGSTVLCTSNIGCALHLAAGGRSLGLALEVLHPITLLARQMGFKYGQTDR